MDAFESLVADILEDEGYWTRTGYHVELSVKEKKSLGATTMPRPEIDIVAYKPKGRELLWVECKSFFDSPGVKYASFKEESPRYRVFTDPKYRKLVSSRLVAQLQSAGLIPQGIVPTFWLVAGHIASEKDKELLGRLFEKNKWVIRDDDWLRLRVKNLSSGKYRNAVASMVAKLLV